jgi:hypothetical protein
MFTFLEGEPAISMGRIVEGRFDMIGGVDQAMR